jgi:hypothetical protein
MLAEAPTCAAQGLPPELMLPPPDGDVVCLYTLPAALTTVARQLSASIVGCNSTTTEKGCMYYDRPSDTGLRHCVVFLSPHVLYTEEQFEKMLAHVPQGARIVFLLPHNARLPEQLQQMVKRELHTTPPQRFRVRAHLPSARSAFAASVGPSRVRRNEVPRHCVLLTVFRSFEETQGDPPLPDPGANCHEFATVAGTTRFFAGQLVKATAGLLQQFGVPKDLIGVVECFSKYKWPIVRFATDCVVVVQLVPPRHGKKGAIPLLPLLPTVPMVTVRSIQELSSLPANWTLSISSGCPTVDIEHLVNVA